MSCSIMEPTEVNKLKETCLSRTAITYVSYPVIFL